VEGKGKGRGGKIEVLELYRKSSFGGGGEIKGGEGRRGQRGGGGWGKRATRRGRYVLWAFE